MLGLMLLAIVQGPQDNIANEYKSETPIIMAQNHATNDWSLAPQPMAQDKLSETDLKEGLYKQSTMCVVVANQPIPDCAKPMQAMPIQLSDDMFVNGVAGPGETTCETIETVKRDINGNPQRVYATFCGQDPSRADYRTRETPLGDEIATRPTQRRIGPNEIGSRATN
jgi:hypothetical protein